MREQLQLSGELSIATIDQLVTSLQRALQSQEPLTIDLGAVERIDTAAVQVLLAARREALQAGVNLTFRWPANVQTELKAIGILL